MIPWPVTPLTKQTPRSLLMLRTLRSSLMLKKLEQTLHGCASSFLKTKTPQTPQSRPRR